MRPTVGFICALPKGALRLLQIVPFLLVGTVQYFLVGKPFLLQLLFLFLDLLLFDGAIKGKLSGELFYTTYKYCTFAG